MTGELIKLRKAQVLQASAHPNGQYVGVMVKDPYLGKVWFRATHKVALNIKVGLLVTGYLAVTKKEKDIVFCKNLSEAVLEEVKIKTT